MRQLCSRIAVCVVVPRRRRSGLVDAARNGNVDAVQRIAQERRRPEPSAPDGSTAVHWAVHGDNLAMLNALLAAGAKPDSVTRYKIAPLTLAAQNGNAALVERLLAAGANPDTASGGGQTALMTAARNGSVAAVTRAAETRCDRWVSRNPSAGRPPLMFATGEGNTDAARLLLEFGAKRDQRSKGGYTPLLFAVRNNRIETVKFLLGKAPTSTTKYPTARRRSCMAILNADFDLAAMLLDAGADPNVPDPRGHPLHVVAWLHQPGAPPDFAMNGEDPRPVRVHAASCRTSISPRSCSRRAPIPTSPSRGGSTVQQRRRGAQPCQPEHRPALSDLPGRDAVLSGGPQRRRTTDACSRRRGADPLKPTRFGVTPLMGAACLDYYEGETAGPFSGVPESQRLEAVKLALALGNEINARTTFGDYKMIGTPEGTLLKYPDNFSELIDLGMGDPRFAETTALHGAVICNQPSIVKYLIEQGAEVNAKNRLGWTPL